MRLRPPAIPLITIDPYFSVWSVNDKLTDAYTAHWTGRPITIKGFATVDGQKYRFIGTDFPHDQSGKGVCCDIPAMEQTAFDYDAFSSAYKFTAGGIELCATFTSALIPDDLRLLSRPVSYLALSYTSLDKKEHDVKIKLSVSEEICLDIAGERAVFFKRIGKNTIRMGSRGEVLGRDGDDLRIDWGHFYLTVPDNSPEVCGEKLCGMNYASGAFSLDSGVEALVTFAYDDIKSIEYFGRQLTSYWNRNGEKITDEIKLARRDYKSIIKRCREISDRMFIDAVKAGGEKYAEILQLAYRQAFAAHKIAVDEDGDVLFISKECFSNGCAATVDVSYPSIPLFLIYNPELVKGMIRPIVKFARSDAWKYDFAPHDAGRYPKLNGQVYGLKDGELLFEKQMPVEECGNMIIMDAAVAIAENDSSFALSHKDLLDKWVKYLIDNGNDPENQLCTDDFAGHLAHNCNLSLKAIMGIASYGLILGLGGDAESREKYISLARDMAKSWVERASNGDGSYRLAFDKEGTFSMKYNIVWDKLFGTGIMDRTVIESELASYRRRMHPYGLPLDNRQPYTKSDWEVWTATLASTREGFEELIDPLWDFFNITRSRVPMTDWYWTLIDSPKFYKSKTHIGDGYLQKCFTNRTVQGGLFIKLLEYTGKMKADI